MLCRSQWICFEKRHDDRAQISPIPHVVNEEVLAVIVESPIAIDVSASKVVLEQFKNVDASLTLHNRKSGLALPSDLHHRIAIDRTTKAAFAVDEADDPLLESWPFLLIVRRGFLEPHTGRFVTAHVISSIEEV